MNHHRCSWLVCSLAFLVLISGYRPAEVRSDEPEIGYIIKFSNSTTLVSEGKRLIETFGMSDVLILIGGYEFQLKRCLDMERPWGLYGDWSQSNGAPVYCFPTTDVEGLVQLLVLSTGMETEFDEQAGVHRIGANLSSPDFFVKEVGDWSFGSTELELLDSLPLDPNALFESENKALVEGEVRIDKMSEDAIEAFVNANENEEVWLRQLMGPEERRIFDEQLATEKQQQRAILERLAAAKISLGIEEETQALEIMFDLEALPKANLNEVFGIASEQSRFIGYGQGEAIGMRMTFNFGVDSQYAQTLREQLRIQTELLDGLYSYSIQPFDADYDSSKLPKAMLEVMSAQLMKGRLDVAFSMASPLSEQPGIVLAAEVDPEPLLELEEHLIEFLEHSENANEGGPRVQINARRTSDVRWHTLEIPVGAPPRINRGIVERQPGMEFNFGFGQDEFFFAMGEDTIGLLSAAQKRNKRMLNQLTSRSPEDVTEVEVKVDIAELLPDPDDFMTEYLYPQAIEALRGDEPFQVELSIDTSSSGMHGSLRVDHAVLLVIGDRIEEVAAFLESLDPTAGAPLPGF